MIGGGSDSWAGRLRTYSVRREMIWAGLSGLELGLNMELGVDGAEVVGPLQ